MYDETMRDTLLALAPAIGKPAEALFAIED
jgi:hypothetical protein